jgi:uncharacterized ferredoxin-like protein
MSLEYDEMAEAALRRCAELMAVASRTAPKTRGVDNLVIKVISSQDIGALAAKMREIGEKESLSFYARDAASVEKCSYVLVIGTRKMTLGLNCGFCGYPTCEAITATDAVCAFNSMDLGIALGSAAATAASLHVDNRVMISVGRGAMLSGLIDADVIQAIGIPLSATNKNPFFDRK